jgi:dihydrolipoamide dehydrogenase
MKGIEDDGGRSKIFTVYTLPETAQTGMTEQELKEEGRDYRIGEFPLSSNGKALAEGSAEGYVRVLYDPKLGEVFGVQIFAEGATDMIAEASLLLEMEGTVYDLARTVHAHPTISEIFFEMGKHGVSGLSREE